MGWNNQTVNLIVITITTTGQSGIFGYSPTPGAGNLVFSLTTAGGTDPYGNTYPSGLTVSFTNGSSQRIYGGGYTFHNADMGTHQGTWHTLTPATVGGVTWVPGVIGTSVASGGNSQALTLIGSPYASSLGSDWQAQINLFNRGTTTAAQINMSAEAMFFDVTQSGAGPKAVTITGALSVNTGDMTVSPGGSAVTGTQQFNGTFLWNGYMFTGGSVFPGHWNNLGVSGTIAPFANQFTNRGIGGFPDAAYFIDAFGWVRLRGLITGGAASTIGSAIFTALPAGLRPSSNMTFAVCANGGTEVFGRVDVNSNGTVVWRGPTVVTGGVNWFSLTGVDYLAEQ